MMSLANHFAKMESWMDWNDLRVFLAVAEGGTLSAAAAELGVSVSTVSRRIGALESDIGQKLFLPRRDGYELTAMGQGLVPVAEKAAATLRQVERFAAEGGKPHAVVRIEAPELLAQGPLLLALQSLLQAQPALRIELRGSVRPVRLAAEQPDIVLRLVRPEQGNYRIRKLGQVNFGLYASPDYVSRMGHPKTAEDLRRHNVIGWAEDFSYLLMVRWLQALCPGLQPSLRLMSFAAQLTAVRHGMGWAVLPDFSARAEGFVAADMDVPALRPDLWLLTHAEGSTRTEVIACRDAIVSAIRAM